MQVLPSASGPFPFGFPPHGNSRRLIPIPEIGTKKLKFFVGAVEFTSSVSAVTITSAESESDFVSFADAAAGGARDYNLHLVMKQNTDAAALWYFIWNSAGTDVAVTVWPNGGTVASTTTPKFTGTVTVKEPDGDLLGGEADASNTARFTVECDWPFVARPSLVVV